ncbi:glycine betaine ABC transporter substrate-binding protein [soil metagenome]
MIKKRPYILFIAIQVLISLLFSSYSFSQPVKVGAKHFNEGYILSEIISQLLERNDFEVERKFNLGGTLICYSALKNNEIDIYPEYSGTISEEILKNPELKSIEEIKRKLKEKEGLNTIDKFGFNNTYALTMKKSKADQLGIKKISDLQKYSELNFSLSYEFLKRNDGWEKLALAYSLKNKPTGIEHGLSYRALDENKIDLTDAYSTDGEINKYGLIILEDDKNFFPKYDALMIYNNKITPEQIKIFDGLKNTITEEEMQKMNSEVLFSNKTYQQVATEFLNSKNFKGVSNNVSSSNEILSKLIRHLYLTGVSLFFSIIIGIPLAVLIYRFRGISGPVIYVTGLLQTIPSIALLAFMIPFFGIGVLPAIIALFLYALLPIVRNTYTGLITVDPQLKKVAEGMGLTFIQKLRYIEIPLSVPAIISGIKTAAIINVGTATLAAFIGAGGLGEFIVTGLALNNTDLILKGAIPAALLAIFFEVFFEVVERFFVSKHLKGFSV